MPRVDWEVYEAILLGRVVFPCGEDQAVVLQRFELFLPFIEPRSTHRLLVLELDRASVQGPFVGIV